MPEDNDDAELEELRRRKMYQMQAQQQQQAAMAQEQEKLDAQKQLVLRQVLTPEARERLGRLKTARPDVAANVEQQLIMLASSGRLEGKIDDEMMRQILARLVPEKREIKIERR
jgi:programmed cell death protein 5